VELKGKTALVTGGAVRIGRELALALGEQGANVALHYGSSAAQAAETASSLRGMGREVDTFSADLSDASQASRLIERVAQRFEQIDILVNSAAIFLPGGLKETTEKNWDDHFNINLKSPFFLCRAFALHVGQERPAAIVNIADWRGTRPGPQYLAYTLTKSGIITLTQSLAQGLAPNIRVNAIAPGAILPPPGGTSADLDRRAEQIPLRRSGNPGEVARALLYLLEAEFVTGQILFVDGGERFVAGG
jgi:NAD(P)-dependent dehydrogenase (short-subunit alcohol dehydrogenase family)